MKRMYYSEDKIVLEAAPNLCQIENVDMEEVNDPDEKVVYNDRQPEATEDDYSAGTLDPERCIETEPQTLIRVNSFVRPLSNTDVDLAHTRNGCFPTESMVSD
jgi:hypothetical protein